MSTARTQAALSRGAMDLATRSQKMLDDGQGQAAYDPYEEGIFTELDDRGFD